ncbi:MAG: aspartate aminotransferase family protein [Actinobacteria bacterium]|nr:aspartate aminotransferase family protein [Actinomycetota bacterium]MBT3688462.1 aspartate aminotransferase family protein [Actinomycetota bacterium]MBT4036718.1 aspartate aminotransferase family protein [Actinomycetota bacterium]MBT4278876.1 aspartate aminotransferase family protein [Actinomycetota bacterium]MBT4343011.1 aspartate aminotransferase family protein [Actinomycetota bacterium]
MEDHRAASFSFIPSAEAPPVVERAEGCTLYFDDGREVIDAGGGAVAVNIGHGRAEVAAAVAHATQRVSYVIPPWVTEERIALVETLRERWLPPELSQVALVSGGSESVDSAIRLAISHHTSAGRPERWKVIGRETSYHGTTMTTLAAGGHRSRRSGFDHILTDFPKMPVADAEGLEKVIESEDPATIAAVIAEPVIGAAAGAVLPPDDWWPDVREICDAHGILLIADEVMTGFGRTGRKFGIDHWGVVPDIMVGGKGLSGGYAPLGGVFASEKVVAPIAEAGSGMMFFTFSAHSAACAAGVATLKILEDEDLVSASATKGAEFLALLSILGEHPHVSDVRGLGLMIGIELVEDKELGRTYSPTTGMAGQVVGEALRRGVWVYPAGDGNAPDALLVGPPFTITTAEMETTVKVVGEAISAVCGD